MRKAKKKSRLPRATRHLDVLIIGAGAAGFAAARRFREAKLNYLILEAKSKAGGRALSVEGERAFALGAEFLHGSAEKTKKLLREYGRTFYEFKPDFHVYEKGKISWSPEYWNILSRTYRHLRETKKDRSFADFLRGANLETRPKKLTTAFVEGFNAARIEKVSANAIAAAAGQVNDPEERAFARPVGGYGALFRAMTEDFADRIRFAQVARRVARTADGVRITARAGKRNVSYLARRVLVTVPIGVLRSRREDPAALVFHPPIPKLSQNLSLVEMGEVVRISFDFDPEAFHRMTKRFDRGFPFISSPSLDFMTWWSDAPLRWPTLTAWAGGDHAVRMAQLSSEKKAGLALANLSTLLKRPEAELHAAVRGTYYHDWSEDPFSRGAYSYSGVGAEKALKELEKPVGGKIFFGGEAFDPDHAGTVEGAFRHGGKQADRIIRSLARESTKASRSPRNA